MDRQEVQDKVVEIIRKEKTLPEGDYGVETPLSEVGIDSFDALNILRSASAPWKRLRLRFGGFRQAAIDE